VLNGRAAPVVKVVGQAATSNLEHHVFFLGQGFVLEDIHHVEYIETLGLGVGQHAFKQSLATGLVSVLDDVVKTVGRIDLVVSRSDSLSKLVLEVEVRRSGVIKVYLLLGSVGEELETTGGQRVERNEVRNGGRVIFVIDHEGVDDSFLGQQEVADLIFTEVDVDFISAQVGVEDSVDLWDIILSHNSEARKVEILLVKFVSLTVSSLTDTLGKVTESNIDQLLWVQVSVPVGGAANGGG